MTEATMPPDQDSGPLAPFQRGPTVDHSLAYMGSILTILAGAHETGGSLSCILASAEAGSEPPPHVHDRENELFFVLDGVLEVFCEGVPGSLVAHPGEMIFLPRGRAHALHYRTDRIKMLFMLQALPGRTTSEAYFRTMAIGRAESMELPAQAVHYEAADAETLARAHRIGEANGIALLPAADVARRLPDYVAASARLARSRKRESAE